MSLSNIFVGKTSFPILDKESWDDIVFRLGRNHGEDFLC